MEIGSVEVPTGEIDCAEIRRSEAQLKNVFVAQIRFEVRFVPAPLVPNGNTFFEHFEMGFGRHSSRPFDEWDIRAEWNGKNQQEAIRHPGGGDYQDPTGLKAREYAR
jgi:hypothetical protein